MADGFGWLSTFDYRLDCAEVTCLLDDNTYSLLTVSPSLSPYTTRFSHGLSFFVITKHPTLPLVTSSTSITVCDSIRNTLAT